MSIELKGRNINGEWKSVKVTEDGELIVQTGAGTSNLANESKQDDQITELKAINDKLLGRLITEEWNDFEVTSKNGAGCPLQVVYRMNATIVATINITYDIDGDLQRLQKV